MLNSQDTKQLVYTIHNICDVQILVLAPKQNQYSPSFLSPFEKQCAQTVSMEDSANDKILSCESSCNKFDDSDPSSIVQLQKSKKKKNNPFTIKVFSSDGLFVVTGALVGISLQSFRAFTIVVATTPVAV
uniref:Uncharacterized protein n=1 Tax=Glossina austeni TaxID=7395 RepID=A0A1A9V094_GLOAU